MTRAGATPPLGRLLGPTVPVLFLITLGLAYDTHLPVVPTILLGLLGLLGVIAGIGLRAARYSVLREAAPVPVLVALGVLAAETPVGPLPELLVGVAGVVFIAWLLDDPSRPASGATRAAVEWTIPALGVGLAWTSSFLLPSSAAPLGVAGGLLAASLLVLAYLVRRPDLFDREEAATI